MSVNENAPKISDEEVTRVIREVVKGREDFRYEAPENATGCVYSQDPDETEGIKGSCLVGCVLEILAPEELAKLSEHEWVECEEGGFWAEDSLPFDGTGIEVFSGKATSALRAAQIEQDHVSSWGEALEAFEEAMAA